ncbi:hypothetical protein OE88DRAFT_77269 [Heliocybe sulcata]|uniref:Uncharacterized protein n=1 Tax=Heliocybe sulcata TaxID=5364 RepID=A0A5C3NT84_9AGAM|nr:hypothetical protein OE88DRAFT_77269 [Heliocybe sulcata]
MNPGGDGHMGVNFHQPAQNDAGLNFNPLAALQAGNIFAQPQQNGFPPMMNPFPPGQMQNGGPPNPNWPPQRSQSPMSMQQFTPPLQQSHQPGQQHQAHIHPNGGPHMNGAQGINVNPWLGQSQAPPAMNLASLLPVNNILTDAMRMMVPVGSSPDDEKILIRALLDSPSRQQTYRQALDSLHGVNNHASNLWKDYYLDHKHRIDELIRRHSSPPVPHVPSRHHSHHSQHSNPPLILPHPPAPARNGSLPSPQLRQPFPTPPIAPLRTAPLRPSSSQSDVKPPVKSVKKPTFSPRPSSPKSSARHEASMASRGSSSQPRRSRAKKPASTASSSSVSTVENRSYSYTSTRYVASSANLPNLFPNYADIKVPEPPSRSPSPPRNIVPAPGGKGNRYTAEDKAYFPLKVAWEVKQNPRATKNEILQRIAERAPHHSAQSWRAHWHDNPVADKILATVQADLSSSEEESGDEDADGEDDDEIVGSPSEYEADKSVRDDDDNDNDLDVPTDDDEKEMGAPGESYTDADRRVLARYIASRGDGWSDMTRQEKFGPFVERYPGRSIASWAEYFRRYSADVLRCVRKYHGYHKKRQSPTSAVKRKTSDREDVDDQHTDSKRAKDDGDARDA